MLFELQVRHGAGTGLREVLKSHGAGGGKMVGSTSEQVKIKNFQFCVFFVCFFKFLFFSSFFSFVWVCCRRDTCMVL